MNVFDQTFYSVCTRTTLIRACYGRYSSFRVAKAGMQKLTELYQYIVHNKKIVYILLAA